MTTPTPPQAQEHEAAKALSWFDDVGSINLEEAAPQPVKVTLEEYIAVEDGTDADGNPISRQALRQSTHIIETYVPMALYNKLLLTREQLMRDPERSEAKIIEWMIDMVWEVWKLTEPSMPREKLAVGLRLTKLRKLYAVFFDELLQASKTGNKA
ncbi:MAG TPA: hypothetical protein VFA10_17755 [Ktedonobacteraceae bacterium]|nr:hypothetical protein [Ktedonobacteraceae bacterium]